MEDLPVSDGSAPHSPMPEAGNDPGDPLAPEIEEENSTPHAPAAVPDADMEVAGENEFDKDDIDDLDDINDNESDLSEVDEAQFDDFDPAALALEEREQIAVDDSNVGMLGVHKRKRTEAEIEESRKKKRKEKKRDRPKKSRRRREGSEVFSGGEELAGKRSRKRKEDGEARSKARAKPDDIDESTLTPAERQRRALEKAMDDALKNPNKRKSKKDGINVEEDWDAKIEDMRRRMTDAARDDTESRAKGQPAMAKLKLLPEVAALLATNTIQPQLVDPDTNLLEAVRFFLEPLNDGSLPAYNIQKELFSALGKLPINKDALVASGIGKVVLFYTRSKRPEQSIKRQAERLLSEWMRPILKRTDDYRKRDMVEANETGLPLRPTQLGSQASQAARDRALATPVMSNRARVEGGVGTYTIAPKSNIMGSGAVAKAPGRGGEDAFRRLKMRQTGKGRGGAAR